MLRQRQMEMAQTGVYFLAQRNHALGLSGTQYLYEARCGWLYPEVDLVIIANWKVSVWGKKEADDLLLRRLH
jgi:hypothetical protein